MPIHPAQQPSIEEFSAPGGIKIDNSNRDHEKLRRKGATIVSQDGRGGGQTRPILRFRAYNSGSDGMMTVTNALGRANPAPRQTEVPNEEFEGKILVPGLPAVPRVVNPEIITSSIGEPAQQSELGRGTALERVLSPAATPPPAAVSGGLLVAATGSVKIIGELQDVDVPCMTVELSPDNTWLTLVSPINLTLKLKPDQELTIETPMGTGRFWFTGIATPLPFAGAVVRIFGLVNETTSQEGAGAVS